MSVQEISPPPGPSLTLIWGVPAIARAIGRSERATYHKLSTGQIPGGRKVGGSWCLRPDIFLASFREGGK